MAIVRITKKQIEEANKAREAALKKDAGFRQHHEHLQQVIRAAAAAKNEEAS
jgi:hypothetical protein